MPQPDPRTTAPEHLFRWLLQVAGNPPDARLDKRARDGWEANLRQVADRVWAEAWTAGAGYGLSIQPARVELAVHERALNARHGVVVSDGLLSDLPLSVEDAIRAAKCSQEEGGDHAA